MKKANFCLGITFVKSILCKRIVIKFFCDYCFNSRVCSVNKRVVNGLLWTIINCLTFIFRFKCE